MKENSCNPKVSIIIATYNSSGLVKTVLKSVEKQSYANWECIVVDGKSTDTTLDIVKHFVEIDNRFKFISEPDRGVYDAFNKGWEMATGDWIYYIGSDDELLSNGIRNLIKCSCGADLVYGGIISQYRSGKRKEKPAGNFDRAMPFSLAASHQAMIMKRSLIEKLGGFNLKYKILADYDLINRAFCLGIIAKRCSAAIAVFKLGGLSTDNLKSIPERYNILTKCGVPKIKAMSHCLKIFFKFLLLKVKHRFD